MILFGFCCYFLKKTSQIRRLLCIARLTTILIKNHSITRVRWQFSRMSEFPMIPMLSSFPTVVSLRLCRPNMLSKLTMPHFLCISSSSSSSSPSSSFSFFTSTWGLSTQLHQATKNRSQPIHRYSNFFFPIAMLLIFLFQSLWFYALFIFSQVIFIMVHIWNPIFLLLKPNFALFSL